MRINRPADNFSYTDGLPCDMVHVADLPFEEVHNHFFVMVEINDKPSRLLFDTGAFHTVITPEAAKRLG